MLAEEYMTPQAPEKNYLEMIEQIIGAMKRTGDRKKVLGMILPYALALTKLEVGALLVTGDAPDQLQVVAQRGLPDEVINQLRSGSLGNLLLMGQQLWVKPRPLQLDPEQALLGRHKLKYLFGVPCRFEGWVSGAIIVGSRTVNPLMFDPEEQHHLAILAQLLAVFLDDVRLRSLSLPGKPAKTAPKGQVLELNEPMDPAELEQLLAAIMAAEEEVVNQNRDLRLLNELSSQIIGTLQLSQILETAVVQTGVALKAKASWCYLLEEGQLRLRKHQGLSEAYVQGLQQLELGNGVESMAFSRNEIIARDNLLFHTGSTRNLVRQEGLKLVAAVPLHFDNEPVGVLVVAYDDEKAWTVREKRMLLLIGHQLEQALLNALKYNEVQEQALNWESNYQSLQQSNKQLAERAQTLEIQVQLLHQLERQIWAALSASPSSNRSNQQNQRRSRLSSETDEALATTLKTILTTMNKKIDMTVL